MYTTPFPHVARIWLADAVIYPTSMGAAKPSKKQRGKLKAAKNKKETAKTHVKFDDNGDKVVPKKRARAAKKKDAEEVKEGGGKSDRSPEMIQQAKYYLEQWQKRDETKADDELPWKFKVGRDPQCTMAVGWSLQPLTFVSLLSLLSLWLHLAMQKIKQQWILQWMYEADVVPKAMFAIVLEYLNGIQGAARTVSTA